MLSHRAGALLVLVLAVAMLAGAARASEFSADLDLKEPSGDTTLKLHVKGRVYRLEGEDKGQRRIVIVDRAADTATVIDPQAKTYEIIKGFKIAWVDPFYQVGIDEGEPDQGRVRHRDAGRAVFASASRTRTRPRRGFPSRCGTRPISTTS